MVAMVVSMSGLTAMAASTTTPGEVGTSFSRDDAGGSEPIIKVKWEMKGDTLGKDDSSSSGAQFLPSGRYQVDTDIEICAIVTDPDGISDINNVYANVFYPEDIYLGPDHEADRQGCGQEIGNQITLHKLDKMDGISLFCDEIRNKNNNLPYFNEGYDYDGICANDGQLQKETSYVYCGTKTISYEDPSGDYRVSVMAQDKWGLDSSLENYFTYLPLTAFEIDFNSIDYGSVKLNTPKIVNGDLNWDDPAGINNASIRNVGNTRTQMYVWQDDMGLGKTDSTYNVKYRARIGNDQDHWRNYVPYQTRSLLDELNLSEMEEMDFSIEVTKFPSTDYGSGLMKLSAKPAAHLLCAQPSQSEELEL